jgi:hypothetical protein
VAVAFLQEWPIRDGDTSTTNYDAISAELNLQQAPDGLLIHTAGFDHDSGLFRIFDVWESPGAGRQVHDREAEPDPRADDGRSG